MISSTVIQVWNGDGVEPDGIRAARLFKENEERLLREAEERRAFYIPPPKPGFEGHTAECPVCNQMVPLEEIQKRRSEVTHYENEEGNWFTGCYDCFLYSEQCWQEQMDEYHASIKC